MIKYIINKLNFFLMPLILSLDLVSLEILEVKLMDSYKITREFPGKLLPAQQSNLAFEIPGKINVINVDIGDTVRKGQILAELDDREASAQLKQAKARYDLALQILNRYKDLRSEGHISIQDLDNANSEELIAKSQYEFFKVKLEQTKLIAPFDGVIQNRYLDRGSVINGGIPIVEILGSKNVEAHISIPLKFIDKLIIGNFYDFTIGNKKSKGVLERLAPMTPGGSDNRLAIFNFDTFFAPGSIAELKLSLNIEGRGTWVPIKSLSQSEQGIWAIYTINEEKVVVRDLVEILYFEGEYAYVNGTLNDGDLIVLGGAQKIIEGKSLNIQ
ncbi:MAG: efflux RND transporter periplasmic adaptor subunit [Proteobacteria bacterium]|jgi:RND family efflux transporter MFP subunit|nr:efflux RND transporter periplasmic adaptor subunit [Pseudomonadota bacterium]